MGCGNHQNGVSGSYMDAVFELVAHEESESWTSLPHSFTKESLLQLFTDSQK